jgi:hypothetical protein
MLTSLYSGAIDTDMVHAPLVCALRTHAFGFLPLIACVGSVTYLLTPL